MNFDSGSKTRGSLYQIYLQLMSSIRFTFKSVSNLPL